MLVGDTRGIMRYKDEGMNELSEELKRTGVISEDFKRSIMDLANWAIRDAYERGRKSVFDEQT